MKQSSEYTFTIFLSSTDYNLIDLRAELSRYLSELGYRPILSSHEGFPDGFPDYEPWEVCLKVLEECSVVVLVIDGRYGSKLPFPKYKNVIGDVKVSPTHGEYKYAHHLKKRMLVFIREEVMTYYQCYREAKKKAGKDPKKARLHVKKVLPDHIEYEVLEFINEVKTTTPIPWIKTFKDVTDIKKEVQKKMLNELVELFKIKQRDLATISQAFSSILDDLTVEKRQEVLMSIGVTKELIDNNEKLIKDIETYKQTEDKYKKDLEVAQKELANNPSKSLEKKIVKLKAKIADLESSITEKENERYIIKNSDPESIKSFWGGTIQLDPSISIDSGIVKASEDSNYNSLSTIINTNCDNCKETKSLHSSLSGSFRYCFGCNRNLCSSCFGQTLSSWGFSQYCKECKERLSKI